MDFEPICIIGCHWNSFDKSISMFIGLLACMRLVEKSLSQYCDSFSSCRMVRAFCATVELLVPK